ncbi:MAG: cation-translocating P-type ATPase, partial [Clostridiales bacterium]|nr:cation-translocating P-type ATPase [Clostridiales bacterium]
DTVLTKGAVDVLLKRTVSIRDGETIREISKEDTQRIEEKNREFSEQGLRVLAFAYRESKQGETLTLENEKNFIFIGLVAMIDPPREEAKDAVAAARRAGIRPVMITGDHKITATAIAKQIGIFRDGDIAMVGTELDSITDKELDQLIGNISVFARVSPENKIRIVESHQRRGAIVSMTGDGVNDAPALKKADIGVAMGITGTEVSKDAASMILADDNFATIIKAVANGRNVYKNIRNAILFLLSGNMAGIMAVLYTSIAALPMPFAPVHLLFINLLTDSLPALAIGMEPMEKDVLSEKPRNPKEGILTLSFMRRIFWQGGLIAICTMAAFHVGLKSSAAMASTMAFATLTLSRLFHVFNCRSRHSIFKIGFSGNWYSLGAFILGVLLLAAVTEVPLLRKLFAVEVMTMGQIGVIALLAGAPTVLIQLGRVVREIIGRK